MFISSFQMSYFKNCHCIFIIAIGLTQNIIYTVSVYTNAVICLIMHDYKGC